MRWVVILALAMTVALFWLAFNGPKQQTDLGTIHFRNADAVAAVILPTAPPNRKCSKPYRFQLVHIEGHLIELCVPPTVRVFDNPDDEQIRFEWQPWDAPQ